MRVWCDNCARRPAAIALPDGMLACRPCAAKIAARAQTLAREATISGSADAARLRARADAVTAAAFPPRRMDATAVSP